MRTEEVVGVKQTHLEFIPKGFEKIMCSSEVQALCEEVGGNIQERANSAMTEKDSKGFAMSSRIGTAGQDAKFGTQRNITFVYTTDHASIVAEARDKVLSKAVY